MSKIQQGFEVRALEAMSTAIMEAAAVGVKVTIAATGPLTNIALFISVYRDLLPNIARIVFMGGAVGMGNRSATAGTF